MTLSASYDVRIWKVEKRDGVRSTTHRLRWSVAGKVFSEHFATAKLADSFRATLLTAARQGEAFDRASGRPVSMRASRVETSWVQLAHEFIDIKWAEVSARHRRSTVEGLVTLTCALVRDGHSPPDAKLLREALTHWEFNTAARAGATEPPDRYCEDLLWIDAHSLPLDDVASGDGVRRALQALSVKLDGGRASASTISRKRAALSAALNFAVEKGYLSHNPLRDVRTRRSISAQAIDPRVVVNPDQARDLLNAVKEIEPPLYAFFACIYYAGLRPAEARNLRRSDLELPEKGWGEILLKGGYQEAGRAWTDNGARGEERHLKHRAEKETRPVPAHPNLVRALRVHMDEHGTGVGGRLFVTRAGRGGHPIAAPYQNPVSLSTVYRVWRAARATALTAEQCASPLAGRPYDLRHACVSTWLHAGVDASQVAAWAGHSVAVLLRVYASCLDDREQTAKRRIETLVVPDDSSLE